MNAQKCIKLSGVIYGPNNNKLSSVIITLNIPQNNLFSISKHDGSFLLDVCNLNDSLKHNPINLTFNLIGYFEKSILLNDLLSDKNLHSIILDPKTIQLSEVIVHTKPIIVNGDTTIFKINSFQNKLDNNLEDVLRKMPGFDVDATGNILFNGKPIENVLIEGDVLTKNYKQISKNIEPGMIDRVEIIDKYNSNSLLKDLSNSNRQVMNLKLKNPKKLKTFGSFKASAGIKDRYSFTGNIFVFNSFIKTMSIASKNNIGESPYNEILGTEEFDQIKDNDFDKSVMPNYITEDKLFTRPLFSNAQNTLFNRSQMLVLNNSIKLNEHLNLKYFADVYSDKISQFKDVSVTNLTNSNFSFLENSNKLFSPLFLNNHLQFTFQNKKNQILFATAYNKKKYNMGELILAPVNYVTEVNNLFNRFSAGVFFTHKIDSNRALQAMVQNNYDTKFEKLTIEQNEFRDIDSVYKTNMQNQAVNNRINYNKLSLKYLFRRNDRRTHSLSISNTNINSKLNSTLGLNIENGQYVLPGTYLNFACLQSNNTILNYSKSYSLNKLNITVDAGVSFFQQRFNDFSTKTLKKNSAINFVPNINLSYNFNSLHQISVNIGYNNELPNLAMQTLHPVLASYRSFNYNEDIEGRLNNLKLMVSYSYRKFEKGASFILSWYHFTQFKSLISNISFAKDFDYYQQSFTPANQDLDHLYFKYDKYIYKINTGISVKNSLLLFSNPSIVNGQIADRKNLFYNTNLSIRPSIGKNVNTSFGIDYLFNQDLNANVGTSTFNPFVLFSSTIGKKMAIGTKLNFYKTNYFVHNQNYYFVNTYFWYYIKRDKVNMKLSCINITNTTAVYNGYKGAFIEKSIINRNLPRYGLLEISYKFR